MMTSKFWVSIFLFVKNLIELSGMMKVKNALALLLIKVFRFTYFLEICAKTLSTKGTPTNTIQGTRHMVNIAVLT